MLVLLLSLYNKVLTNYWHQRIYYCQYPYFQFFFNLYKKLLFKPNPMEKQKPQQSSCLGCRTFFEQSQTLPLECANFEYKNFSVPLLEHKHKWTLLKTIVSFLNTKGGTILIGVEDSNCKVVGKQLPSKARDEFKLYLLQLVERIQPQVDLIQKEEIVVQYVPVLKAKSFSGKYIIKILVQQGNPAQTYCFSQKIQWALEGKKEIENQCENIEVVHSYVRHNMGGAKEIKGLKLIEEASRRGQNPAPLYNTFHEECNPEPPCLEVEIRKIGFKNLGNRQSRRKFQRMFSQQMQKLNTEFQIVYDTELKAVVIQLSTAEQFRRINNFIRANLSVLNESQEEVRFVQQGDYLDIHLYENTLKKDDEKNSSPKKEKPEKNGFEKKVEEKTEKKEEPKKYEKPAKEIKGANSETQAEEEIYSLTFTHINPHLKDKLINYLTLSISKKIQVLTETYLNTIEVIFSCPEDLQKYSLICTQANHLKALETFGWSNQIRLGLNTGHLHILNYDKAKEQKLLVFLRSQMKGDLKEAEILKRGNRYIVDCKMTTKGQACQWLDKLLMNRQLKDFSIPGAKDNAAPKMKVFIHCEQIKTEK